MPFGDYVPASAIPRANWRSDNGTRLRLFAGFVLHQRDCQVPLPPHVQRLIALIALRTTLTREQASGTLWPDVAQHRAGARLRTALWRMHRRGIDAVEIHGGQLFLAEHVSVDVRCWTALALRVLDRPESVDTLDLALLRPGGDLLPGWYDDWVLMERERIRQLQLHMLETAGEQLLACGRHAAALEVALGAVQMEPARESAHRLVIRIHLAEGNTGEAWRQFERCHEVLARELGVGPSELLRSLL
jgi:DNA-binding SARP family transcriptional activator